MTWAIETIIDELKTTISDAISDFKSVDEPGESLPPDGPFCLIEFVGGPIELGNLEDWTLGFRITAGVARNAMIGQERKAVRGYALQIIAALRGNVVLGDSSSGATLNGDGELGLSGEMSYANVPFVGCSVTVHYQATDGVVDTIFD